jgi:hypothetical protein
VLKIVDPDQVEGVRQGQHSAFKVDLQSHRSLAPRRFEQHNIALLRGMHCTNLPFKQESAWHLRHDHLETECGN